MLGSVIFVAVLAAATFFLMKRGGLGRFKGLPPILWLSVGGGLLLLLFMTYSSQTLLGILSLEFFAGWMILIAIAAFGPMVAKDRRLAALNQLPPPWPPRQPDDWGRDLQRKYQRDVKRYQRLQESLSHTGVRSGGSPPLPPIIPSWHAFYASEQAKSPLQIRWAQTDAGDWLRVIYGNRARPPAKGSPTPVFQMMQRQDTGDWVWIAIPADNKFDWQHGPQRMEDLRCTDAKGRPFVASRPCGHPGYQEPFQFDDKSDTHGTADPLSDDDLADMGSAPSHYGPTSSPVASAAPVAPAKPLNASPGAFGSAAPLSDDDLFDMGAAGPQQPSMPPQAPSPHRKPPEPDPSSLVGIL